MTRCACGAEDNTAIVLPQGAINARDCFRQEETTPEHAFHAAGNGFDLSAGRLVQTIALDAPAQTRRRMLIAVHHLAVDAVSWPILLADLDAAYAAAHTRLPAKTASLRAWAAYLHDSVPDRRCERALWREQAAAPVSRIFDGTLDAKRDTVVSARHVVVSLDPAETQTLLRRCPPRFMRPSTTSC